MTQQEQETLESYIDKRGLVETIRHISEICEGKADHVATNWQDKPLSKAWYKASAQLANTALKLEQLGL